MAYSEDQWSKARGYYEAGLSLSQITTKTKIARNTISQRAKREQWEHSKNSDYIEAKEIIAIKKGTEREQSIICADEVAEDNIRRKNLVFNAQEKAVKKLNDMIDFTDAPQDMKHIVDSIDKASLTLGVNQRHSNSQVQVNNTNAIQNNVSVGLEDFYK